MTAPILTTPEIPLENWVYACVSRLTDNYEWAEMYYDGDVAQSRKKMEDVMISALMADEKLANAFVDACLDRGIVEESYFEDLD
jgi:hypothetical protein